MGTIELEDFNMSSVAMILMVASVAATPPADVQRSPAPHVAPPAATSSSSCGPQIDPQFVHFVPPAPSAGSDGLFRLISSPEPRATQPDLSLRRLGRRNDCARMLFTGY
jgi:hypothetical protein